MNDVRRDCAGPRIASLGLPRPASAAPLFGLYTRTQIACLVFLLLHASRTPPGRNATGGSGVLGPAAGRALARIQQQGPAKWYLRGVFSATSRGESSSGRTQLARIKNYAKNARGSLISTVPRYLKSLAKTPRCASPAAYEGQARFATMCAMATTQSLVARRRDGPFASGLETFRARR